MTKSICNLLVACALMATAVSTKAEDTIFFDNMENGTNDWAQWGSSDGITGDGGLWHQSTLRPYSGSKSWYYGFENGNFYESLENMATIASPTISLVGYTNATLSLRHFLDTENDPNYDFDSFGIYVIDEDGGDTIAFYTEADENGAGSWSNLSIDISKHAGKAITIYIDAYTTSNCSFGCWWPGSPEGWYIDDVKVVGN